MMFAKTFCKPGSYVEVAPIGLQAMLQYNRNGLLQKVCLLEPSGEGRVGFNKEVDHEILNHIYSIVPTSINLKDGTTWVEGVFFTKILPNDSSGNIAYCATDEYLNMMRRGEQFEFFAGNVRSLAASFKGALTIRNWLMSNRFKILPGIVVPVEMKQETLNMMFSALHGDFNSHFIAAFFIFEGMNETRYVLSDLYYTRVIKCTLKLTSDGYAKGELLLDSNEYVDVNYSDACNYFCTAAPNVHILFEECEGGNINILTSVPDNAAMKLTTYICPVCHSRVILPPTGPCQCGDRNCLSRLYPDACKMLTTLSLPTMSYEAYKKLVDNKDIICLTDILTLDNYKDENVCITLPEALFAITPVDVVPSIAFFEKFIGMISNSLDSLMYYLKNPRRILTELIDCNESQRFANWVSDPYNLTSVTTLLSAVEIKGRSKKFEGVPMFRNNSFVLTGDFKRGSYKNVASILESYEAKVLPDLDLTSDIPNAVITGGTNENISGRIIKTAKSANISIVDEDSFFNMYGIDDDLSVNLL